MATGSTLIRPQDVVRALDRLVAAHGLTNEQFYPVHHFWEKGRKETIRSHREWAAGTRHYHDHQPSNIVTGCRIMEWLRLVEEEKLTIDAGQIRVRDIKTLDDVRHVVESWHDPL